MFQSTINSTIPCTSPLYYALLLINISMLRKECAIIPVLSVLIPLKLIRSVLLALTMIASSVTQQDSVRLVWQLTIENFPMIDVFLRLDSMITGSQLPWPVIPLFA